MRTKIETPVERALNSLPIRAFSKKELAVLYKISDKILRRWFNEHPELEIKKSQKIFNVKQVEQIFKTFGIPHQANF